MKFKVFFSALFVSTFSSAAVPVDGWYSSIFGGYAHLAGNVSRTVSGFHFSDSSYKDGFNVGGRLGYQSYPMRYELEYTYIKANTDSFKVNSIPQTGLSGNSNANALMANIYYDFTDVILPTIFPFVGIGIGVDYNKTSLNSTGPLGVVVFNGKEWFFAYQGTAGLTYNFSENFALNASYRYLATSSSGDFGKTFQAQLGDVGVVYRFDCNYK